MIFFKYLTAATTASPTSSAPTLPIPPTSTPDGASYYQSFEVGTFPFADQEGDPIWSTTNVDAPTLVWEVTDEEAATGIYSLKNPILDNELKVPSQTNLTLKMPDQGAGALHFSVLAGNQMPFDRFEFYVDGIPRVQMTDPRTEFEEFVLHLVPGAHSVDFMYQFNPLNIPASGLPPPEAFPERTGLVYIDNVYFVSSGGGSGPSPAPTTSFQPSQNPTVQCWFVNINIVHDSWPQETSWTISSIGGVAEVNGTQGGAVLAEGYYCANDDESCFGVDRVCLQ